MRLPAIGHHVAELIGEFRLVALADIDNDPGHTTAVGMQPDLSELGCVFVDAKPRRLAVGNKADAVEACVPHALDDLVGARGNIDPDRRRVIAFVRSDWNAKQRRFSWVGGRGRRGRHARKE